MGAVDYRSRRTYRLDLSSPRYEALSEELERHSQRDRGRRLAELAALGLEMERMRLSPVTAGAVVHFPAPPAVAGGQISPPSPALPPAPRETAQAPTAKPVKSEPSKSMAVAGEQLEGVAGWVRDMDFPIE